MPKRLTPEEVRLVLSEAGYTMTGDYINATTPLSVICPNNHSIKVRIGNFKLGSRCPKCIGRVLTESDVAKAYAEKGFTLLSSYSSNKKPIQVKCPKGHVFTTSWNRFTHGHFCAYCSGSKVDHDFVESYFADFGYRLLSEYKKASSKLEFICPNGHHHQITWGNFKSGWRCAKCSKPKKFATQQDVEALFNREGYKLLSKYESPSQKLDFICPVGHSHSISYDLFSDGVRCGHCRGLYPSADDLERRRQKEKIRLRIEGNIKRRGLSKNSDRFSTSNIVSKMEESVIHFYRDCPIGCEIDHIVPVSYFNLCNEKEVLSCWSIDNIRYLGKSENHGRGNKLTIHEVQEFTDRQLEILAAASLKPKKWQSYIEKLCSLP